MRLHDQYTSPRPITITTANILDAAAIKTSIATVAAITTYTGAALNGADANPGPAYPTPDGHTDVPQYPLAVAAANAGSYVNGSTIVFTGLYGGKSTQRTATVVGTDGSATFIADGPLDSVISITIGAQVNTGGSWTFGFTDIGAWCEYAELNPCRAVRANDAGVIASVDDAGHTDLTPFTAGQFMAIAPSRIVASTTTVLVFTLYR